MAHEARLGPRVARATVAAGLAPHRVQAVLLCSPFCSVVAVAVAGVGVGGGEGREAQPVRLAYAPTPYTRRHTIHTIHTYTSLSQTSHTSHSSTRAQTDKGCRTGHVKRLRNITCVAPHQT